MTARAFSLVGSVGLGATFVVLVGTACTCGPAPAPPSTETCESSSALTATDVRIFRHAGEELVDGSSVPLFFGAQGGSHWGFDLIVTAEGAGECVDVDLDVRVGSPTGAVATGFSGGVRARIVETGVRTSQIVVFPTGLGSTSPVFVTATAYGATRTVTLCPSTEGCLSLDAGARPDGT